MADNSPAPGPVDGSGARSWRTPALVALLVLVIIVVVAFLVRGNESGGNAADQPSDSSGQTTDPGSPSTGSTGSTGSSPSDTDSASPVSVPSVAPGVDLDAALKGAFKAKFPAVIASEVPPGWTLIAANWSNGLWTMTFTVPGGATAELFQSHQSEKKLLAIDLPDAQPAGTVDLKKFGTGTWNAFQGPTGFGLTHAFTDTVALVVAPDQATAVTLAQQLLTAEDGQLTNDD